MKRNHSLWLGLVACALVPALAQTPAPTGKIHGHVTNPTGAAEKGGTISLSTDGGHNSKFTFPVSETGDYAGEATPGTYTIVFRKPETPADKLVDSIDGIKIIVGLDVMADDDMSRKDFISKLPSDVQKQLEELKKKNAEAMKANEVVKNLNADLRLVNQDIKDADGAKAIAAAELGASASKEDLAAKEAEIKTAKYTEIETLMLKDTAVKADASVLWAQLGRAQLKLKKYDEAEANYKKVIEIELAAKKQNPQAQGEAYAGLGEIYVRTNKPTEADASYDAAAKANPTAAGIYYTNQATLYFNLQNTAALATVADKAILADPKNPIAYYLKAQGLVGNATVDKAGTPIAPAGCLEAYHKYLELAPTGAHAAEVQGILAAFEAKPAPAKGSKK